MNPTGGQFLNIALELPKETLSFSPYYIAQNKNKMEAKCVSFQFNLMHQMLQALGYIYDNLWLV